MAELTMIKIESLPFKSEKNRDMEDRKSILNGEFPCWDRKACQYDAML